MPTTTNVHASCPNCGYEWQIPVNVATEIGEQKPEAVATEIGEQKPEAVATEIGEQKPEDSPEV